MERDTPLILQRLIWFWVVIFFACLTMTGLGLVFHHGYGMFPTGRAMMGLMFFGVIALALVSSNNGWQVALLGVCCWLFLTILSALFWWPHPMYRYAALREVSSSGKITSDKIYLRSSPTVDRLEKEGGHRMSSDGGSLRIERYLYSPRAGLILEKTLATGFFDAPEMNGNIYFGSAPWLLGVRAASEEFAFYAINLTPLAILYGLYCNYRKKPQTDLLETEPLRALCLLGPAFCLGLTPLIGA